MDFKPVVNHSPGKFFKSDSAIFCYTGKIDKKGNRIPYTKYYYCYDMDDSNFLQLGYIGFSICSKKGPLIRKCFNKDQKIYSFVLNSDYLYLFADECYYKVDLMHAYKIEKIQKRIRVSQKNGRQVISIEDNDSLKVFSNFEHGEFSTLSTGLKGILDVYEKDSLLFAFNTNAFVVLDKRGAFKSLPIYYADMGLNNFYSASDVGDCFLYMTDGNHVVKYDYKELVKNSMPLRGKPVSEMGFSLVFTLPKMEDHIIMKHFSSAVLFRDEKEVSRSHSLGEKFIVSKFNPGNYQLLVYDKLGNVLLKDSFYKVSYSYLVGLWAISAFLLIMLTAVLGLLYKNRLRKISDAYIKRDMDYNISMKQKLSVSIPHLYSNLFNSLSLSDEEANIEKYNMVSEFSSIILMYNSKDEVSLTEEVLFCRKYFELFQTIKEGLRFYYRISNHTELLPDDVLIPTFMIQPIIENSFTRYKSQSSKNSVFLHLTIYKTHLEVLISDAFSIRDRAKKGGGFGFKIVGERITNLRKKYKGKASIIWNFKDKKEGIYTKISIPYEKL